MRVVFTEAGLAGNARIVDRFVAAAGDGRVDGGAVAGVS
jgi:hypothetical protein